MRPDSSYLALYKSFIYLLTYLIISFLPREAMLSAVYAVVVCLSVCLSHSGIVSKRLNVGSRKQCRTIDAWLYFSGAKDHGEIRTGSPHPTSICRPYGGVGWDKIGHFRRKTRYNSKTVQDGCIVFIKVE